MKEKISRKASIHAGFKRFAGPTIYRLMNGHDPFLSLKDVLERLPTQKYHLIHVLLPHNWYSSSLLKYWHIPELSRTAALNFLVKESIGDLIVRLDARTHIDPDYISKIYALSLRENVANVGGVQVPIGESERQKKIALIMSRPLGLGGGKFRNTSYRGKVDSLYLGAFSRKYMPNQPWFDERLPKISEDSDLNFRIRQMDGEIVLDSNIIAWHYPRESLKTFFRLCFNYGVGRALFLIKHRQFSAPRQLVLPFAFLIALSLLGLGIIYPFLYSLLFIGIFSYLALILFVSFRERDGGFQRRLFLALGFVGCHFFWTIGLFYGLITYRWAVSRGKCKE